MIDSSRIRQVISLVKKIVFYFFVGSIVWVLLYKWINPPVTSIMLQRFVFNTPHQIDKHWVDLNDISSHMKWAVIASEDQTFFVHNGFDVRMINNALTYNSKNKKVRGASTISQQVAKNVFLWHGRSWIRKGLEAYFTVLIEVFWSKKRILEVYLNVIETGKGVYGVERAGYWYFHSSASKLTKRQAALIAVMLPNPLLFKPHKPSSYMVTRSIWVMRQMNNVRDDRFFE